MLLATLTLAQADDGAVQMYTEAVTGNLLTEIIVIGFAVIAIAAYYLKEKYSELQANRETTVAWRMSQHRRKEQTLGIFTDGIPQNLSLVYEIFLKRSYLRRLAKAKPEEREPYLDGRSYRQISLAYERDVRLWLTECRHFTSICALVRARFDDPTVEKYSDTIRELFEMLNDLTPMNAVVQDVAGRLLTTVKGHDLLGAMEPNVQTLLDQSTALCEQGHQQAYERTHSLRLAREIAQGIDKIFVRCTVLMSEELRHPPVDGLRAVNAKRRTS